MNGATTNEFWLVEAMQILERTPGILREWLSALPAAWLDTNEGADTFSPRDVLGHLILGERTDWMVRVKHIIDGRGDEPFEPFDRFGMKSADFQNDIEVLLDEFAALRAANLVHLRELGLKEQQLSLAGLHPELGPVTLGQLLATWTAHDLSHLAQIARVMAKRYSDDVGPWRAYLPVMDR